MLLAQAQVQNIQSQIANRNIDNMREQQEARAKMGLEAARQGLDREKLDREDARHYATLLHKSEQAHGNAVLEGAKLGLQAQRGPR